MTRVAKALAAALFLSIVLLPDVLAVRRKSPASGWPEVCYNQELLAAMQIIDDACKPSEDCRMAVLEQLDVSVDRPTMLAALTDPNIRTQHIFFKSGNDDVRQALHWSWKAPYLKALSTGINKKNSIIYVIGQASPPGNFDANFGLSQRRAQAVVNYLQTDLGLTDVPVKVGWLGEGVFHLTAADAVQLRIDPSEFDSDIDKLNQSVHVFVYPCADRLRR